MALRITSIQPQRIELRRNAEDMLIAVVGCFVGLVCLLVAAAYLMHGVMHTAALILLPTGLLFCVAPVLIVRSQRKSGIAAIDIDAKRGQVRLVCGSEQASIPFADILDIRAMASDGGTRRNTSFFDINLLLHEGAFIALQQNVYGIDNARALETQFRALLTSASEVHADAGVVPAWLDYAVHGTAMRVHWQKTRSWAQTLGLLAFLAVFFSIVALFFQQVPDDPLFRIVLWGIAGVGFLILVLQLWSQFSAHAHSMMIELDAHRLRFWHENAQAERSGESAYITDDIALFGFAPYAVEASPRLFALDTGSMGEAERILGALDSRDSALTLLKAGIAEMQHLASLPGLDVQSLSVVRRLQLRSLFNAMLQAARKGEAWHPTTNLERFGNAEPNATVTLMELARNTRLLGTLGMLNVFLPAISLVAALPLMSIPNQHQNAIVFSVISYLHQGLALWVCVRCVQIPRLRWLGWLSLIVLAVFSFSVTGAVGSEIPVGFVLFVLSVLLMICGWQLLREVDPAPTGDSDVNA